MKLLDLVNSFIRAEAARTSSEDPLQKFKYRVSVPGIPTTVGFQTMSGLSEEVAVVEYNEGGFNAPHKIPGRTTVGEVTLERGVFSDNSMYKLFKKTTTNSNFRGTMVVEVMDAQGTVRRTHKLAEAWCSKWEGTDLDATSDDVALETITIQYEYQL